MEEQTNKNFCKTVIINRAVSGSGKTTISRCITDVLLEKGLSVGIHSTDNFFMQGDRYVFNIEKLNDYHAQNLSNFIKDLEKGVDVVICDNMNLLPWQSQPYTNAARKYNYRVLFLNFYPRELEKHLVAQTPTPEKPDAHGLSKELLERFIKNFNDYNDLLDKNTIRDIKRHRVFIWNDIDKTAMDTGELAQYFDSDYIINIRPDEYHQLKTTIAKTVLDIISKPNEEVIIRKNYLLTWYGITDIRAALGLESSDGPLLSALQLGKYTDAIILGYTNPNKQSSAFSENLRKEWETLRIKPLRERLAYPRDKAQVLVDAICNTDAGHDIFLDFIESARLPVKIHFIPQELSHLNDARSIDEAERRALQAALSDSHEKSISCFLSPGTPLMAYTWANISRENPNLHLRIIASSDPRKPPEEIVLPKDIISSELIDNTFVNNHNFDAIIHLLGTDTNLPQYFSMIQFPSKNHYFITSAESKRLEALKRLCPEDSFAGVKVVDAFNMDHSRKAVADIIRIFPASARIGVNLTGGTKLMFAGAINACNEFLNTEPFYFDIKQHNIIFIRTNESVRFNGLTKIDGFFNANGFDILNQGEWRDNPNREKRKDLTLKLWANRDLIGEIYKTEEFKKYNEDLNKFHKTGYSKNPKFNLKTPQLQIVYDGLNASMLLRGKPVMIPAGEDLGEYISGAWLEEYAFLKFSELLKEEKIFDLRIGMTVHPSEDISQKTIFGEFDCVFTDGNRLFIVECKAGALKQEHIQKLENNLKLYGGISAQGILFTSFPPGPHLQERINMSKSIQIYKSGA